MLRLGDQIEHAGIAVELGPPLLPEEIAGYMQAVERHLIVEQLVDVRRTLDLDPAVLASDLAVPIRPDDEQQGSVWRDARHRRKSDIRHADWNGRLSRASQARAGQKGAAVPMHRR